MWRKARAACFPIAGSLAGFTRFHAERRSVSGTSRLEYRPSSDWNVRAPWGDLLAVYIDSYFDLSEGDMYQSKPSLRPGASSSSSNDDIGENEG